MTGARPRVVLLRGHHANVWDLEPWSRLLDEFDVSVLVTGTNVYQTEGLAIPAVRVATPRDLSPARHASRAGSPTSPASATWTSSGTSPAPPSSTAPRSAPGTARRRRS